MKKVEVKKKNSTNKININFNEYFYNHKNYTGRQFEKKFVKNSFNGFSLNSTNNYSMSNSKSNSLNNNNNNNDSIFNFNSNENSEIYFEEYFMN